MIHIKNYVITGGMLICMGMQAIGSGCVASPAIVDDQSCPAINEAVVLKHKQEINRQLNRGRYITMGLKTAVIGFAVYGGYSILSSYLRAPESGLSEKPVTVLSDNASWQEGREAFNRVLPIVEQWRTKMAEKSPEIQVQVKPATSESFISSFGVQLFNMLGMSLASTICLPYLDKLVFKDDITWFISQKTHLTSCLEQLTLYAETLKNSNNVPCHKVDFAKNAMREQLTDLMVQVEKVLGFMDCLVEQAREAGLIIPDDLCDMSYYIKQITNDFSAQVHERLLTPESYDFVSLVKQLRKDLENGVQTFGYFDERVQ